jgi:hypothetical protein
MVRLGVMLGTIAALATAYVAFVVLPGCGTDATGVDQCKQIEEARCRRAAAACPDVHLTPPYSTTGSAADECVRFYDTACLHGLENGPPKPEDVDHCVAAIAHGTCDVVQTPESSPACAWLIPPAEADASSVAAETSSASDGSAASQD